MKTERTSSLPLFHTHPIGSLPRPKVVLDLIARRDEMDAADYQRAMDSMVLFAIQIQEQAGLDVISDGEWRRTQYIQEYLNRVGGFEKCRPFTHQGEQKFTSVVVRRMGANEPVFVNDAQFLVEHTERVTKFALPSPFLIVTRYWHEDFSTEAYPTRQHFMEHLVEILSAEAQALASAGIDIVQLDDPALTYFCDRQLMDRGETHDERLRQDWDPERQIPDAINAINQIASGLEAEVHLHCCHSVYKRMSDVTGDYKPIMPYLENVKIDRVNLEFAYTGTGDPSDLSLLPGHLGIGMGVVDVRGERVQEVEEIESLAAAGAEIISPERIALNPDCGFAPDSGEPPTIDEAYEKLSRLTAAAGNLRARPS